MTRVARVWAAMSGGVDSSVAAALLLEEGHSVTGATMLLCDADHLEPAAAAARAACERLGIQHVVLDLRGSFERSVVSPYCDEYASGRTPNPCVACNDALKFGAVLAAAEAAGADALASGHYARVVGDEAGRARLARGADVRRDQSYFLYRLDPERLGRTLFPLGEWRKEDVREYAARAGLPTADRDESREACFVPEAGRESVLAQRRPDALERGPVVDEGGAVLGLHRGVGLCTVGQRKGLGVAVGARAYVTAIDAGARTVTVSRAGAPRVREVVADEVVWHGGARERLEAMVRYRGSPAACDARLEGGSLRVAFAEPVAAVAPGQAVVCYAGDTVVGGGRVVLAR